MSGGFVWIAYLAAYGAIVGYVATLWGRLRRHRGLEGSEQRAGER